MDIKLQVLIEIISSIGIIASILYGARQIEMSKTSNTLNSILYIQKENFEVRKKMIKSTDQIISLLQELNDRKDSFISIYSANDYDEIREFGYHYELIGLLVKNKSLAFKTVFELIPFPDDFWNKSEKLRLIVRKNHLNDFWENFEYLGKLYFKMRLKNR